MKIIIYTILLLFVIGCYAPQQQPQKIEIENKRQPPNKIEINPQIIVPPRHDRDRIIIVPPQQRPPHQPCPPQKNVIISPKIIIEQQPHKNITINNRRKREVRL